MGERIIIVFITKKLARALLGLWTFFTRAMKISR